MVLGFIVTLFIFLSIYSLVYQFYLDKKMRISLVIPGEGAASADLKTGASKKNALRKILQYFSFLANHRVVKLLARRSIPAKLVMAGSPLSIVEYIILKVLCIIFFIILGGIILPPQQMAYTVIAAAFGFVIPDMWLNMKIKRRHFEIRRDLPQVIDLLTLCVAAGLDFMLSVGRVVKDFKKCPITDELAEMWRETRMGASRREALQHLSRRVNLSELSSFVRTLLQADRMGSPMGEALKIQAEEMRMHRFLRGEEAALKAPIKLLFPLFCFILPAVLVIVAGPIMLQFMKGGLKF